VHYIEHCSTKRGQSAAPPGSSQLPAMAKYSSVITNRNLSSPPSACSRHPDCHSESTSELFCTSYTTETCCVPLRATALWTYPSALLDAACWPRPHSIAPHLAASAGSVLHLLVFSSAVVVEGICGFEVKLAAQCCARGATPDSQSCGFHGCREAP